MLLFLLTIISLIGTQFSDNGSDSGFGWWIIIKLIMIFSIIIVGLIAVLWLVKNYQQNQRQLHNNQSFIKIIESRSLSPKTQLHILQIQDHIVVCAENQTSIKVIHQTNSLFKQKLKSSKEDV